MRNPVLLPAGPREPLLELGERWAFDTEEMGGGQRKQGHARSTRFLAGGLVLVRP